MYRAQTHPASLSSAHNTMTSRLTAHYASATGTHVFSLPLVSTSSTSTSTVDKTAQLSNLRASVSQLQDEINVFLTAKMDEDKATAADAAREEEAERGYGEEAEEE